MTIQERLEALASEYQDASESRFLRDGEKVLAKGCADRIRAILKDFPPSREAERWAYEVGWLDAYRTGHMAGMYNEHRTPGVLEAMARDTAKRRFPE